MSFVIDAHAHIYPDKIAYRASQSIGDFYKMPIGYDGTVDHLLELGNEAGVDMFLVQSVAVSPERVSNINDYIAREVSENPDKFIGFGALHPDMEDIEGEVSRIEKMGLMGIKLHPDIQKFNIDDKSAYKIYEVIEGRLPLLIHTGDNRYFYSDPKRVPQVLRDFPKLQMICAHFGGWSQWNEAEKFLADKGVWVDTSSSMYAFSPERARELISVFGEDYVVFGSDYPMWSPGDEIKNIERLNLDERVKQKIFYKNIAKLLNLKI